MTPTAVTPAARTKRSASTTPRPASPHPSTPRSTHRAPLGRTAVPRTPRRVSGPTRPTAPARPAVLRPASRRASPASAPRRAPEVARPFGVRAIATLRTLPDRALLDRIVRGRWWIPLLGVLLAGIVAMQVEVLKLNASIGHSMVRATALQAENQLLRSTVSRLSDDQRMEAEAARLGMSMPPATQPLFVAGPPSANLPRALRNIHAPNPTAFAAQTSQTAARRAAAVTSSNGE